MNDIALKTRKELAELLKVSVRQIIRYEKEGLPVLVLGNNTKRYDYEEVLKWIQTLQGK